MPTPAQNLDGVHLSRSDLERLQAGVALEQGEPVGVRDSEALDAVVAHPLRRLAGIQLYDSPPRRAAALTGEMLRRRPFKSSNVRTALAAIPLLINREGWFLLWTPEQIAEQVENLAGHRITEHQFFIWLTRMCLPEPGESPGGDPGVRRAGSRASLDPGPLEMPPEFLIDPPDLGR
jgi:prophage maintenance system killer protein